MPKCSIIAQFRLEVSEVNWKKNRSFINIVQIFIDSICLCITYMITVFMTKVIFHAETFEQNLWIPILFGMVYVFTMYTCEMYNRSTFTYQDRILKYVSKSCLFAALFCLVMIPFTSKDVLAVKFIIIYILVAIIVLFVKYLTVHEFRQLLAGKWKKRVILVGLSENIQQYLYYMNKTSFRIYIVNCIYFTKDGGIRDKNRNKLDELNAALKTNVVDEVIFAIPYRLLEEIRPQVFLCKDKGLTVRLAVDFFEDLQLRNSVHTVGTIPVFTYYNATLNDLQSIAKRVMDIIGAMIGLLLTFIASLFIIPVILITSGRPVIRKREHVSSNGRIFNIYSFRTKNENDHSECFISRLLRRTSMDNLPMFWNVLKGDMSLVGSLPIAASNLEDLKNHRFKNISIKPGLTGDWRFGDRRKLDDGEYLADLNENYINKWSLARDCWIILKTIGLILTRKPASLQVSLFSCLEDNRDYSVKSA